MVTYTHKDKGGHNVKIEINFDMDGTIADFYGVEGWLDFLIAEDVYPYAAARPLVNMQRLAYRLNRLIEKGHNVNIISWTSRNGSDEYNERVAKIKMAWLKQHLASVHFKAINIIPYGTPKQEYGTGILFDDEEKNRTAWGENAYDEKSIFDILKGLE